MNMDAEQPANNRESIDIESPEGLIGDQQFAAVLDGMQLWLALAQYAQVEPSAQQAQLAQQWSEEQLHAVGEYLQRLDSPAREWILRVAEESADLLNRYPPQRPIR
ncbi:hypothetical protein [Bifidobacterium gallicum]|nr:hypothetical protein [Bifidobacterium gallicum]